MTPKQQYEARKAERIAARRNPASRPHPDRGEMMEVMFDRFITAVERIADALDRAPPPVEPNRGEQ